MKCKWMIMILTLGTAFIKKLRRSGNDMEEKESKIKKQEEALKTYKQWISLYQNNHNIGDYLKKNDYHSVAIYGLGRVGKNLFDELESQIEIDYVIDQKVSMERGDYKGILCYHPRSVLPKTDLIIVTVSAEAEDIISQLSDCKIPMISIQNLIECAFL